MNKRAPVSRVFLFMLLALSAGLVSAQAPVSAYPQDPMSAISIELTRISRSVQSLTESMKSFVDKFSKVGGLTLTDKQQRLVLGMELLVRAEQRVATLQKFQIELVEKQNESRAKLSQVESDLRPRNIERSTAFEGTTETEELRESRRNRLQNERTNLRELLNQIQLNAAETAEGLREAQALVARLRRTFLPQIDRELYDQQ